MQFALTQGTITEATAHALVNPIGPDSSMDCGDGAAICEQAHGPVMDKIVPM